MPLQRLIISESGRDTTVVAGSACVAVAAIGALLLHMGLPTLAAIVGLPAWAGVIALLGWRLHAYISFPLVLGLASIGDRLLVADAQIGTGPRLLMLTLAAVAWGAGWGWRQQRVMADERQQHTERLHWQESLTNLMLNSTSECVKLISPDGTLLQINPAGVHLLGATTADDLVGKNWFELWGVQSDRAKAAFADALTNGAAVFEAPGQTLRGEMREWRNRISIVREPGGEIRLLCLSDDISAASVAEAKLQQQLARQQQLLDCLPIPAFTLAIDGRILHANARAVAVLLDKPGRSLHNISADKVSLDNISLRDELPPATMSVLETHMHEALRSGQRQQCQFYWGRRMVWLGASLIASGDNAVTVMLNDLSNALSTSPRRLDIEQWRLAQEISGVGDWMFNYREGLLILSESALTILGLSTQTPLKTAAEGGHKSALLGVLHPDDRIPLVQAIIKAASNAQDLQLTVRRLDALAPGGVRYLSWRGRSVSDLIEGVPRLIGAVRDVTQEQALTETGERWRRLFNDGLDALPLDILVVDREGIVVAINANYRQSQRSEVGDVRVPIEIGENYLDAIDRAIERLDNPKVRDAARANCEGIRGVMRGELPGFEFDYVGADRDFHVRYAPIEGTNLTVAAHADVTATKRLTHSIAEHDRRLAQAMSATQDGVWVWAPDSGKTFYSSQFGELLNYAIADLPAFDEMLLTTTHPDDQARVRSQLGEFNPPVDRHVFSLEVRLLVGSSNYRWFRLRGEVQRTARGDVEIVGSIMDIQAERDLQQKIYDVAFRDEVTHLPNRQAFYQHLQQLCAEPQPTFALLLVDLDRFKNINSSLGVAAGDDLLRQVAERLPRAAGTGAFIARLAGDEFAVVIPYSNQREQIDAQIHHILDGMRPAFHLDGQDMFVSASIGAALCPQDGQAAEQLLRAVDVALRGAKSSGRNGYRYFESSLHLPGRERLVLETELRQALERNEFELFYQGKFDLRSDELIGAEALLRWRSRDRGLVAPGEFVPLLEETGLILDVGEWALRDACRQVNEWHVQTGRWIHVAVNVSTIQMSARAFGESAIGILRESGIPPQVIELEITESALMADIEQGAQLLKILKLAGFSIALDDFGTGYSSLGYLRRFSPNTLKMDRSFMADLENDISAREIAAGIVQLARALSIDVVAEGVETKAQRDILRGMRCPIGQGYLFAKPIPAPEFAQKWLVEQPPRVVKLDKR